MNCQRESNARRRQSSASPLPCFVDRPEGSRRAGTRARILNERLDQRFRACRAFVETVSRGGVKTPWRCDGSWMPPKLAARRLKRERHSPSEARQPPHVERQPALAVALRLAPQSPPDAVQPSPPWLVPPSVLSP